MQLDIHMKIVVSIISGVHTLLLGACLLWTQSSQEDNSIGELERTVWWPVCIGWLGTIPYLFLIDTIRFWHIALIQLILSFAFNFYLDHNSVFSTYT